MLPEDVQEALGGMKTLLSAAKSVLDGEDGKNRVRIRRGVVRGAGGRVGGSVPGLRRRVC